MYRSCAYAYVVSVNQTLPLQFINFVLNDELFCLKSKMGEEGWNANLPGGNTCA